MKKKKSIHKNKGRASLVIRFLKGNLHCFIITAIASVMVTLLDGLIPQLIRFTADVLIGSGSMEEAELNSIFQFVVNKLGGVDVLRSHFYFITILVLATALLSACFRYLSRVSNTKGSEMYARSMKNALYSHIERLPFSWHTKNNTGDIIQRCTTDVDMVRNFVSTQLTELFRVSFSIVFAICVMVWMNWRVALVAIAFVPIVLISSILFHSKTSHLFMEADESEGVLSTVAQENLTGVRVVRAFGRELYERERFEKANEVYTEKWVRVGRIMSWFWCFGDLIAGAQTVLVLVFCIFQSIEGNISAGDCIAFISYNQMLLWPVRYLGRMISELSKASVSIDRLNYILSAKQESDDGTEDVDFTGDIEFKNVTFSYGVQKKEDSKKDEAENKIPDNILSDISFKIKGGQTLGIMGGTGSGKSTLVGLLCRMYDLQDADDNGTPLGSGSITIGGVELSEIKKSLLRKNVGIVLQEPFLFSRTIGENISISMAAPGTTLSEEERFLVEKASANACVDEAIKEFTLGYDTVVGERGVTLSGGQKQRVAIARMLIGNTPIVIFDDSLSAVDTETDRKIRESLAENLGGATVIMISHRITTLMGADNILVLENGKITEAGTHSELVQGNGTYRKIYEIQQAGAAEAASIAKGGASA